MSASVPVGALLRDLAEARSDESCAYGAAIQSRSGREHRVREYGLAVERRTRLEMALASVYSAEQSEAPSVAGRGL